MNQTFPIFKALLWKQARESWMAIGISIVIYFIFIGIGLFLNQNPFSNNPISANMTNYFMIFLIWNTIILSYFLFGNTISRENENKTLEHLFTKPLSPNLFSIISILCAVMIFVFLFTVQFILFLLSRGLYPNIIPFRTIFFQFGFINPLIYTFILVGLFIGSLYFFISTLSKSRIISMTLCLIAVGIPFYFKLIGWFPEHKSLSFFASSVLNIVQTMYLFYKFTPLPFLLITTAFLIVSSSIVLQFKIHHTFQGTLKLYSLLLFCLFLYAALYMYAIQNTNIHQVGVKTYRGFYSPITHTKEDQSKYKFSLYSNFWDDYTLDIYYSTGKNESITNPVDISHIKMVKWNVFPAKNDILLDCPLRDCFFIKDTTGELTRLPKQIGDTPPISIIKTKKAGLLKTHYKITDSTSPLHISQAQLITHLSWSNHKMKMTPVKRIVFHFPKEINIQELKIEAKLPGIFDDNSIKSDCNDLINTITNKIEQNSLSEKTQIKLYNTRIFLDMYIKNYLTTNTFFSNSNTFQKYFINTFPLPLKKSHNPYSSFNVIDLSDPEETHIYISAYTIRLPSMNRFSLYHYYPTSFSVTDHSMLIFTSDNWDNSIARIDIQSNPFYTSPKANWHGLSRSFTQKRLFLQYLDYHQSETPRISFFDSAFFIWQDGMIQAFSIDKNGNPKFFGRYFRPYHYYEEYTVSKCTYREFLLQSSGISPTTDFHFEFETPLSPMGLSN